MEGHARPWFNVGVIARVGVIAVGLVIGCGRPAPVVEAVWRDDATVLLVATRADRTPIAAAPRVLDGPGPLSLEVGPEPFRLFARALPPVSRGGPDLSCGVVFGGAGLEPSPVEGAWSSEVIDAGDAPGTIVLSPDVERPDLGVRLAGGCRTEPPSCAVLDGTGFAAPLNGYDLLVLAWVSPSMIVAGGRSETAPESSSPLFAFDGASVRVLDVAPRAGPVFGLAFDHRERLVGVTKRGQWFELDLDGRLVRSSTLARLNGARLDEGPAGEIHAYGPAGVFRLTVGSTVTKRVAPHLTAVDAFAYVRPDRIAAVSRGSIHFFDGSEWRVEYTGPALEVRDEINAMHLSANAQQMFLVNPVGRSLLRREESSSAWVPIESPFGSRDPRTAAVIGSDAVIVLGTYGIGAISHAGGWCHLGAGAEANITDVVIAPDGTYAVAVTKGAQDDRPYFTRIDLPAAP